MKTGILLHVYHLDSDGWEYLAWGRPETDELGVLPRFAEVLMRIPADEDVLAVIYSGPSSKDGLSEGAYTKQYLLNRINQLADFPRLRRKLERLDESARRVLVERLQNLTEGRQLKNTYDEVSYAANLFRQYEATNVVQVAAASHAPRCLQMQAVVKEAGLIDHSQLWSVVASDLPFHDTTAKDLLILEPHHRGDDPMSTVRPSLGQVLRPYLSLPAEQKKQFIKDVEKLLKQIEDQ